jgi:hypothetical protein
VLVVFAAEEQKIEESFQEDEELQGLRKHHQLVMVLEVVVRLLQVLVLLVVVVLLPLGEVQLVTELNNPLCILVVALQVLGQEDALVEAFLAADRAEVVQAVWPFAEDLHLVEGVRLAVEFQVDVGLKIIFKNGG